MPASSQRIRTIDWLRGISVLLMLVAHSLIFLSPAHDHAPARAVFNEINGLPGPTFILAAGFSLALVSAREGDDVAKRQARANKSIARIGQVFFASLVLRHVMWDSFRHPERWPWVDVLTCIGLMLLMLWTILFVMPTRARGGLIALMAVVFFAVAPWVDAPRTFGPFTTLLNNGPHGDTWPLVPWAGYGFVGALIGQSAGRSARPTRAIAIGFGAMIGVGLIVAQLGTLVRAIDAGVSPWNLTNSGTRLWKMGGVGLVLLSIEIAGVTLERRALRPAGSLIGLFSRQSLIAYVTHLVLIFGYWGFRPLNRWLYRVDWGAYVVLTIVVIGGTTAVCWGVEGWGTRSGRRRMREQARG